MQQGIPLDNSGDHTRAESWQGQDLSTRTASCRPEILGAHFILFLVGEESGKFTK